MNFLFAPVALKTLLNLKGIDLVANFNGVIVFVQIAIILVFIALMAYSISLGEGEGAIASVLPFYTDNMAIVPLFTGATILCFSFLGFDGLSSLTEETKDAQRVIPRAIVLTALIGGVIFVGVSYFLQLYFPDISRFQ